MTRNWLRKKITIIHSIYSQQKQQLTTETQTMTYSELRKALPANFKTDTLGGRNEIEFHNPAGGYLMAINSRGNAYHVTEADWNNACVLRSRHSQNPWASKHYTGLSSYTSYGLIYAAAMLRTIEQGSDFSADMQSLPRTVA